MPLSIVCKTQNGDQLKVGEALKIREQCKSKRQPRPTWFCIECGQTVKPHRESRKKSQAAHFEHYVRNPKCDLSDPHR